MRSGRYSIRYPFAVTHPASPKMNCIEDGKDGECEKSYHTSCCAGIRSAILS
jgi:hypothetical protein